MWKAYWFILIFTVEKKSSGKETGSFPSGLYYWSLIFLQVFCSKLIFKNSKIIIAEIPFFTCKASLAIFFLQLSLAVSWSSRIRWTLMIQRTEDGLRGHKTARATTLLAQIASVVFLCCLTICYQENTKCCSFCAKVLQDFLRRFTKISKRDKKEAEKKPLENCRTFLSKSPLWWKMSQKTLYSKNISQLHELWMNVDPGEIRIRPNLFAFMLNSWK